ncbi:MAG TPA: 2-oxo-4-hydroxy-4-carboxy-5-ureidoimidazoline decarboxylase [Gaiellaceae bacterium]|nr:2-oxo-4-hydroxy-4-carboxy-5-ureidoimidazoline decarboxylase [Gaiellaceae bacterium]
MAGRPETEHGQDAAPTTQSGDAPPASAGARELPRGRLTPEELAPLYSGRTRLVERLARAEDPLRAEDVLLAAPEDEQAEALAAHPRIGEPSEEQRGAEPEVLEELARLNEEYERRFGFRFVTFVAGRTRAEVLPELRQRLGRTRAQELETGLRALAAIARDRWTRT